MEKAAIEIPEDYLSGLKLAAKDEDGDLSSFVLEAMLENYEAAKEDRSAMCGDTGTPRWYGFAGCQSCLSTRLGTAGSTRPSLQADAQTATAPP